MSDRRNHEELVVITKTYDLILWSCHHTSRFPRNHRFVLGERIERNLYGLLETLIQARYTRQRQPLLEQANRTLGSEDSTRGSLPATPEGFPSGPVRARRSGGHGVRPRRA